MTPGYAYRILYIENRRVAVVLLLEEENRAVAMPDLSSVASALGVRHIIVRDADWVWNYWSAARGLVRLEVKGTPVVMQELAEQVAAKFVREEDA